MKSPAALGGAFSVGNHIGSAAPSQSTARRSFAAHKIGGFLKNPPKKDARPTLAEAGIDKNLAKAARK